MRRTRAAIFSVAMVAAGVASASGAAAQTTTTVPPVRSIPVTPATTTTTAPARAAGTESAAPQPAQTAADLADTGVAADRLVPLGLLLIGVGAALQGVARRPRRAYGLL